jgi:hypothetical protein
VAFPVTRDRSALQGSRTSKEFTCLLYPLNFYLPHEAVLDRIYDWRKASRVRSERYLEAKDLLFSTLMLIELPSSCTLGFELFRNEAIF